MFFNFVFLCLLSLVPVLAQYSKFCDVCKWTVISKKSGIKCEPSKNLIHEYDPKFFDQCPDLFKKNDNPHFFQFDNLHFNDSTVAHDFNFLSKVPDISSLEIRNSKLKNLVNASDSVLSEYKIRYSHLKNLTHISGIPSIIKHLDFEGNQIHVINSQAFTQFIHLRTLNLRLNQLRTISSISFRSHALELIDFENNQIELFNSLNFEKECGDFHLKLDFNRLSRLPRIKGEVNKISMLSIGQQQSDIWDSVDNFVNRLKENLEITRIIFEYNNGAIFSPVIIKLLNTDRLRFDRIQFTLKQSEFKSIRIDKFLSSLRPHSKITIYFRFIGEVELNGYLDELQKICSNTFLNINVVIDECKRFTQS